MHDKPVRDLMSNYLPIITSGKLNLLSKKMPQDTTPYVFTIYENIDNIFTDDDIYPVAVEVGDYTRKIDTKSYVQPLDNLFTGETIYKYVIVPTVPIAQFMRNHRGETRPNEYTGDPELYFYLGNVMLYVSRDDGPNTGIITLDDRIWFHRQIYEQGDDYVIHRYTMDNREEFLRRYRINYRQFVDILNTIIKSNLPIVLIDKYFEIIAPNRFRISVLIEDGDIKFLITDSDDSIGVMPIYNIRDLLQFVSNYSRDVIIYDLPLELYP